MKSKYTSSLIAAAMIVPALALAQGAAMKVQTAAKQPYGKYLTDASGRALYVFSSDSRGTSTCYEKCAQAWPPLGASAKPEGAAGVSGAMLGTTQRKDGTTQVTYNGMPLYYFVKDQGPGTTAGQGIHGMGGEWYLISPAGQKIDKDD